MVTITIALMIFCEAGPRSCVNMGNLSLNLDSNLAQAEHRVAVLTFSLDHIYLTLVLQRSMTFDIEPPIERTGIPDCSYERVLVIGGGCLISVPGPVPLYRSLNMSCERAF